MKYLVKEAIQPNQSVSAEEAIVGVLLLGMGGAVGTQDRAVM